LLGGLGIAFFPPSIVAFPLDSWCAASGWPDPERAVSLGLRCIGTARSTGSARITKELRTLDKTLARRWPTFAGTAEFHEALAAA
jgi:hypothetical protein